jgi:hypothetical protein
MFWRERAENPLIMAWVRHLFEAALLLKLMVERNYKIKKYHFRGLNLSNEQRAEGIASKLFFCRLRLFWSNQKNSLQKKNDLPVLCITFLFIGKTFNLIQIGFREMMKTALRKEPTNVLNTQVITPWLLQKKGKYEKWFENLNL